MQNRLESIKIQTIKSACSSQSRNSEGENSFALSTDLNRSYSAQKSESKSAARTYVHNRVTSPHFRKRLSRSERSRERLETKNHLAAVAVGLGETELADKLRRCHSRFAVLTCGQHIAQTIPNFTCEFRLCPDCARRRSRKLINKYLPIMRDFLLSHRVAPVHLVLTQKHRPESRKQSVKRLFDAFTKLQRRAFWKEHFQGGIWSLEFTKGADGLHHTHLHLIAFRSKFFDIGLLRDEWRAVTGDSHILRLDKITDLAGGLLEVVKYISKPLDIKRLDKEDLADFLRLKNMRFFGTFGEFRKFARDREPAENDESEFSDLSEGCACPKCHEPLFDLRLSAAELVRLYERIEGTCFKGKEFL